jgi:flagellar basal body P-ring protein FlgI
MNDYNIAIRDQDFNTAQAIADQINNIDVQITQLQSQMPMGLGEKKN